MDEPRPPLPPFDDASAAKKVRMAEDAWNTRDPQRVALAYTPDSTWRNRAEFLTGREAIVQFLVRKWSRELDYRLIKELWAHQGNRIAVRFAYEWHDDAGNWFRSYGNENWEFDERGFMRRRIASINDLPIKEGDRKYHWALGRRPDDHPSLSDLGLQRHTPPAASLRIDHVALWTEDIERCAAFYAKYFGATAGDPYVNPSKGFESRFLVFASGARIEVMRTRAFNPVALPPGAQRMGWTHVALGTGSERNVDELTARLRADGYQVLDGPRRTGDGYYESVVLDPDGNRLELTV